MIFTVANLGDAALSIPSSTVASGGIVGQGGLLFCANDTSAPMTLTLDAGLTPFLVVKDIAGNAGQFPITISSAAGIDAGTSVQLTVPYQWIWLSWNGAGYSTIG